VILTIERYVAVCWPFHAKRILRQKLAIYSVVAVIGFVVVVNIPRWIEAQQHFRIFDGVSESDLADEFDSISLQHNPFLSGTGILRYRAYRQYYHGVVWITLIFVLPTFALTFFNFKILQQVSLSIELLTINSTSVIIRSQIHSPCTNRIAYPNLVTEKCVVLQLETLSSWLVTVVWRNNSTGNIFLEKIPLK